MLGPLRVYPGSVSNTSTRAPKKGKENCLVGLVVVDVWGHCSAVE